MQRPTSTPSKFLAWQMSWNRRQLRHQTNTAIDMLSKTGACAIDPIHKLSQQTEAVFATADIAEIETTNLRTKYAGKKARAGPGGGKKLTKGTIADWKFLEKWRWRNEKRRKLWPKQRPRERVQRKGRGLGPLEQRRKQKYTLGGL